MIRHHWHGDDTNMSHRAELHKKMVRLKNEDLLGHSVEIRRLRRAIDAIDAWQEQEQQKEWRERQAKHRDLVKRNRPSLFWRILNWI
jgi:hypothetical protein